MDEVIKTSRNQWRHRVLEAELRDVEAAKKRVTLIEA
jgi:hypothetical protein